MRNILKRNHLDQRTENRPPASYNVTLLTNISLVNEKSYLYVLPQCPVHNPV